VRSVFVLIGFAMPNYPLNAKIKIKIEPCEVKLKKIPEFKRCFMFIKLGRISQTTCEYIIPKELYSHSVF
jgi:hypothetical protein